MIRPPFDIRTIARRLGAKPPFARWLRLVVCAVLVVGGTASLSGPTLAQSHPGGLTENHPGPLPPSAAMQPIDGDRGEDWSGVLTGPLTPLPLVETELSDPAYSGHSLWTSPARPMSSPVVGPATEACYENCQPWNPASVLSDDSNIQILPRGLMYQSYLAGEKESRISSAWLNEADRGLVWDVTLGGRVGLWRYGTDDPLHPEGFQIDIEGAALVRLDPEANTDVEGADFRFGILGTWRSGPWATKYGYYHLSSHVGDEFLLANPGFRRLNYVRDSAIAGLSYDVSETIRLYTEAGYSLGHEGGALPWEFQYGAEYSSADRSARGGPYAAVNGHTREDLGWISGVNVVSGWQWRGEETQHRFRVGVQYYNGPALQYSFVGQTETLLGAGLWFDF